MEQMTAKEFLNQYLDADRALDRKLEQLARLRAKSAKVTAIIGGEYAFGRVEKKDSGCRAFADPHADVYRPDGDSVLCICSLRPPQGRRGALCEVSTQRQAERLRPHKSPQDAMVTHIMDLNAAALIEMAHRRLCGQADFTTCLAMTRVCSAVIGVNPEFSDALVPMCEYRGGCHEMNSCGAYKCQSEVLGHVEEQ